MENNKIKRYALIEVNHPGDFVTRVNEAITDGWQPIGGISVAVPPVGGLQEWNGEQLIYTQALVHYGYGESIEPSAQ